MPFKVRKANCVGSAMTSKSLAEGIPFSELQALLNLLRGLEKCLGRAGGVLVRLDVHTQKYFALTAGDLVVEEEAKQRGNLGRAVPRRKRSELDFVGGRVRGTLCQR
jgi:hypothetical protein